MKTVRAVAKLVAWLLVLATGLAILLAWLAWRIVDWVLAKVAWVAVPAIAVWAFLHLSKYGDKVWCALLAIPPVVALSWWRYDVQTKNKLVLWRDHTGDWHVSNPRVEKTP